MIRAKRHSISRNNPLAKRNRPANSSFKPLSCGWRTTQDEIHGLIDLCPVSTTIIDTVVFQRLRGIKQLGTADIVYMNANHNRLEHSMGVATSAENMCQRIMDRQPYLGCTAKDKLSVKIAALTHDIGHGPFSHVYEVFVKNALPGFLMDDPSRQSLYKSYPGLSESWQHESTSLMMIDLLLEELGLSIDWENLDEPLKQIQNDGNGVDPRAMRVYGVNGLTDTEAILTSRDFIFIKECIWGGPLPGQDKLIGRPDRCQEWLYDIVNNRRSGLDVDKLDYFARDERRAKGEAGKIDEGMIQNAIVAWAECTEPTTCKHCRQPTNGDIIDHIHDGKHLMICYEAKMVERCMSFFEKRADLHTKIYAHKTSIAASFMICDILCLADPFIEIPVGKEGTGASLPPSRAMLDPYAMLRLKDSIIDLISSRNDIPGLRPAQELLRRYQKRDIYKCVTSKYLDMVGSADHRSIWDMSEKEIAQAIMSAAQTSATVPIENNDTTNRNKLTKDDFFIVKCTIHHGCKEKNPVSRIRFLEKQVGHYELGEPSIDSLPEAFKVDKTDYPFPSTFQKNIIHVISKTEDKRKSIGDVLKIWWSKISNTAKSPNRNTTSAASLRLLEDDYTCRNNDCTSEKCIKLTTSQTRVLTQDAYDDHHNLETRDMAASLMPRMLTQESDDEDEDEEGMGFDEQQQDLVFDCNPYCLSSR